MPIAKRKRGRPAKPPVTPETVLAARRATLAAAPPPAAPVPEPVQVVDLVIDTPVQDVAPVEQAAEPLPDPAVVETVSLGLAIGEVHRMPLNEAYIAIADLFGGRIAALKDSPGVLAMVQRVRDTEGRCSPIYLMRREHGAFDLFAGAEGLAAAIVAGISTVSVIIIEASQADGLQSFLVAKRQEEERAARKR